VGRWRTQLIARQLVNCRTHEHRHFERTLRSSDTRSRTTPGWGSYQFQRLLDFLYRKCRSVLDGIPYVSFVLHMRHLKMRKQRIFYKKKLRILYTTQMCVLQLISRTQIRICCLKVN